MTGRSQTERIDSRAKGGLQGMTKGTCAARSTTAPISGRFPSLTRKDSSAPTVFMKVGRIPTFSPFTQRLLVASWTPPRSLPTNATQPSHSPDEIKNYAFVIVLQIGQVGGEVGEVVADAGLQVLANTTIDRGQCAAAPWISIRQVKRSSLVQAIPFLEEPPCHRDT